MKTFNKPFYSFFKLPLILSIILVFSLLFTACSAQTSGEKDKKGSSGNSKVVYFKYPDNPTFDLVYLADDLGYFKHSSIKPKYIGKVDANQVIPLVGTGDIDFGTRMASLTISAVAGGADEKIISAGNETLPQAPHMKYFVRKDSGIKHLKDLVGKTIGMNGFGACAEYVTKKYLREHGVDPSKIKWIAMPNEQLEQALDQKRIDLAIIHPPQSGIAAKNKNLVSLFSDWDIDHGLSGMQPYTVNGKFLRAHPKQVKEFVGIIAKAANWVNAHPKQSREYIAKRLKMNVSQVERYAYVKDLVIDKKPLQYWIDTLVAAKQIPKGKVKAADIATNEYNPNAKSPSITYNYGDKK